MTRQLASFALAAFASIHVAVVLAPAVVLAAAADKGGLSWAHGFDLVAASLLLGVATGFVVWRRLHHELHEGVMFRSAFLAEFDALVVLALLSTGLLMVVLGGFAPEHAAILNQGWPVVALWTGVQFVAIGLAERARSAVLTWMEPEHPVSLAHDLRD